MREGSLATLSSSIVLALAITIPFAVLVGLLLNDYFEVLIAGFAGLVSMLLILRDPAWGVTLIASTLTIEPMLIKYTREFAKYNLLLGVLSVTSFLLVRRNRRLFSGQFSLVLVFAGLFVLWGTARTTVTMTAIWTYVQLFVLMFLASEVISPEKHFRFLLLFVLGTTIGALLYSHEVRQNGVLEATLSTGINRNTFAFYCVVALVISVYLHMRAQGWLHHVVFSAFHIILAGSIIISESRAGLLNLIGTTVLMVVVWPGVFRNPETESSRSPMVRVRTGIFLFLLTLGIVVQFIVSDEYIARMEERLFRPAQKGLAEIDEGRAILTQQAWETFLQNPVGGVGLRGFRSESVEKLKSGLTAHNLYVVLLAETGLIGFALYMGWVLSATLNFFYVFRFGSHDYRLLAVLWSSIIAIILIRGFTASALHYDKLFWAVGGISIALRRWAVLESVGNHE